jgi:RNA polymerase sigma-70 factor (ECF subfamily)
MSGMETTSLSLLDRLREAKPGDAAWQRFQDLYAPLVRAWLARVPGLREEIDDLSQEVLLVLVRELPSFERRRDGSFRAWLRRIAANRIRASLRNRKDRPRPEADAHLSQAEDPASDLARQWDEDHDRHVLRKLLAAVQGDFAPATWQAFERFALQRRPAARVAEELGTTEGAVIQARFRVLKRLREEAGAMLD